MFFVNNFRTCPLLKPSFIVVLCLSIIAPVASSSADEIDRKQIQQYIDGITVYLNKIRTLQSEILQINPDGSRSTGFLTIKRPGYLNLKYYHPSAITLIADSKSLIISDGTLQKNQYLNLADTPANFFLQRIIDLSPRKISILKYEINEKTLQFDITSSEVENTQKLTVLFQKRPLSLLAWYIHNQDGSKTQVFLKKVILGNKVDDSLFKPNPEWNN